MSSLASSNLNETSATTTVRRELIIASSFVKSYYTLLNKGPQYIHNFYSDHSSFIHGTVEVPNDNHTGPVVGRDNINKKIQELNLHDCRAKITQIDCLETLSEGLLIQVSGELSNNGQPMRRFMQTFVLARSRDENSKNNAATITSSNAAPSSQHQQQTQRRNADSLSHSTSNSLNEKFYVRNSIFRYQDDLLENEIEDEQTKVVSQTHANIGSSKTNTPPVQPADSGDHKSAVLTNNNTNEPKVVSQSANIISLSKNNVSSVQADSDHKSALQANNLSEPKVVSQSANISPAKTDTSIVQVDGDHKTANISNEPKTWANMVRSSQQQLTSPVSKAATTQTNKQQVTAQQEQQQPNNHNQSSVNQQQNQQSRRRLNRKSSNKGSGGNRPANKIRASRLNNTSSTTASNTAPSKQ